MNSSASKPARTFSEFEADGWEQLSSKYDDCWGKVTSAFVTAMLAALPKLTAKSLLDLATGPGYAAHAAYQLEARPIGVDFSSSMISEARRLNPDIEFQTADVEDLPFGSEVFEMAISNFGFQHFAMPEVALREICRVLKPKGALSFTIWAESSRNSANLILQNALNQHATIPCPVPEGPRYGFLWNDAMLRKIGSEAGFHSNSMNKKLHVIPWRLKDPDELFRAEKTGSVRSGARLRQEPETSLKRIRQAMLDDIESNYSENGGWVIPMAAYVITMRKQ